MKMLRLVWQVFSLVYCVQCVAAFRDNDLTAEVPAGRQECYFQTTQAGHSLEVEYQVSDTSRSFRFYLTNFFVNTNFKMSLMLLLHKLENVTYQLNCGDCDELNRIRLRFSKVKLSM